MCLTVVLGIHPDYRHHFKQDFGLGVDESTVPAVPTGSIQIQPIDVDTFLWWHRDVILHPLGHFVAQNHAVQGPAFVSTSDLLQGSKMDIVKSGTEIGLTSYLYVLIRKDEQFASISVYQLPRSCAPEKSGSHIHKQTLHTFISHHCSHP